MDASTRKHYHLHEFDTRLFLDMYFSNNRDRAMLEETVFIPMKLLHKMVASGCIKGDTLIDLSIGPILYHLFPICEFFNGITILEPNDSCIKEIEKWLENKTDAFDWSYTSKFITELEGNRIQWHEKEERLRKSIKHILKWDFTKENPTDPIKLPKADCLLSAWAVEVISKDKDEMCRNLKKLSSMLKIGGYLLLLGVLNASHYSVDEHTYHAVAYDEDFLKNTIIELGYTIECIETVENKHDSGIHRYEHIVSIAARKQKEN